MAKQMKPTAAATRAPRQRSPLQRAVAAVLLWPKRGWQWLTKMKTALVLLFLLAIAAIPGALLPQRSLNEANVITYLEANGKTAEIFDAIGLFDVFSSPWFAAIYLLLFASLVGCILPRSWDHYRSLRSSPPAAPKVLRRMPHYEVRELTGTRAELSERFAAEFRGWNISHADPDKDRAKGWSWSAERGYLREFANLVFHLSLVGILLSVAAGRLVYYEGQVIIVAGTGTQQSQFCNSAVSNYDSFRNGALFDGTGLDPFCINVKNFTADYLPNGQAIDFRADIDYTEPEGAFDPTSEWEKTTLRVNHPLRLLGNRVYLQGHGFAPTFTITWPNGVKRTETVQFRPDDLTFFLSSGAVRWDPPAGLYPSLYERRKQQISVQGLFAPTAQWTGEKKTILASQFPAMRDPAVAIDIYRGDTGLDAGRSQSVFSLHPEALHSGQLKKLDRVNLKLGESVTLDDSTRIRFDGAKEFVNLQISRDPTTLWVLFFSVLMIASLAASLFIKRRRMWVRLTPVKGVNKPVDDTWKVEVAGLSRTDAAGWGFEFRRKAERLLGLEEEELEPDEPEDRAL